MQLAFWSAALAAGIACGLLAGPLPSGGLVLVACVALAVLSWLRAWRLAVTSLALLLGLGLGLREVRLAASAAPVDEDKLVDVVARVVRGSDVAEPRAALSAGDAGSGAERAEPAPLRSHLRLAVETVAGLPVTAGLVLTVLEGVPSLAPGDRIRFASRLYLPRGFANPGLLDGRLLARGQGIDLVACVRRPADLELLPGQPGPLDCARRWAFRLRQSMARVINRRLAEPSAGFVRTMVVGERSDVPAQVEDGFRAAGATHVLSVSGLHLAVVVALVFHALVWLFARFPSWALRVPPKVAASVLALPTCAFYALLTGEAVATVRAALMAAVVLGAAVVNRPLSLAAGIGAAALLLLLLDPAGILDVSFQLSFASVIGLGLFARWMLPAETRSPGRGGGRLLLWLRRSLSGSLAACLVTMPIVAHHFGEITPAAPLGNLALVPVVELVVLPCGLAGALLALLHPWLGALPLLAAGLASRLALAGADLFRRFAPVLLVCFPNGPETLLLVAAAAGLLAALSLATRKRRRWFAAAATAALLAAASLTAREVGRRTRDEVRVTFLDVGQGDSAVVEGPRGFVALIDGGGRYDGSFDTGARIVEPVLRAAGITRLDLVVLSHPHPDHINGLFRVIERFPVGMLWTNGDDGRNPAYRKLIEAAWQRGIPTPEPTVLVAGGLVVEALGPKLAGHTAVPPGLGTNDASLVLRLTFHGRHVLFTGDIGGEGEAELLDRSAPGNDLIAEVLKVPHHGSGHASSARFIDAVAPKLAVVSAGRFNRFGLPSPAALERYASRDIEVLRTDRHGAVTVTVRAEGAPLVRCERGGGD
jgi:competence protein ComEC